MRELSETEGILIDPLDELENRLLAFEKALANNGDWRSLVHGLFRDTHNLKSAFAMAGYDVLGRLAHGLESLLDRYRSGKAIPDAASTNRMLEATDYARSALSHGSDMLEEGNETFQEVLENLKQSGEDKTKGPIADAGSKEQPSLEIAFPLDSSEMGKLKDAVSAKMRPFILEKLVDSAMDDNLLSSLPVFDAVKEAGSCIAWRIKKDSSGGAVLSILFASATSHDELSFILFDPFYPVDISTRLLQPAAQSAEALIPRILIVDDDSVALMILQHYLALYGRVDTAVSGQEAIDKFRTAIGTDSYDVLFLDIMMLGIDGQAVMGAIVKFGFSPIHIDASRVLPRS